MRYKILLVIILIHSIAQATIRRVGFTASNPVSGVDYPTIQAAHDASVAGDTLQIYPSNASANYTCTMTKRLIVIGTGYYTAYTGVSNTDLQNIKGSASTTVTLSAGASGSVFEGLGTANENISAALTIGITSGAAVNNVVVKRCKVTTATLSNGAISDNWLFTQCDINNLNISGSGGFAVTNLRIENCLMSFLDLRNGPTAGNSGLILNCVFYGSPTYLRNGAFIVQNCIVYNVAFNEITNAIFQNNLFSFSSAASNVPAGNNNQFSVSFNLSGQSTVANNTVFVGYPNTVDGVGATVYSPDARFKLKAGSVALGAGVGGIDCGIYGGTNPYRLSGIPATPAIYKLTSPSPVVGANPYTITFSVRSNN